jgi:hypothetical protein
VTPTISTLTAAGSPAKPCLEVVAVVDEAAGVAAAVMRWGESQL